MVEQIDKINIIELLMVIKEDVSSIKTDMINFKEAQRTEKDIIDKSIQNLRTDYQKDIDELNSKFMTKINNIQSIQNNLVGDVDNLKHVEELKDAKKYRTLLTFVLTGIGGMILAKLPDFISWCFKVGGK